MRSQPGIDESWTEAEAMRAVRGLSGGQRHARAPADPAQRRHDVLARAVQDEVIPRLLLARRPQVVAGAESARPGSGQVSHLVSLVLGGGQAEPAAFVDAMRDGGTGVETLLLELLTPAARLLGAMWEDDTCTFSDVTLGMLRLGNVMRLLGRAFAGDLAPQAAAPGALLVQMPGEQHGFGLAMVVQFFRRAGWRVRAEPVVTSAELADLVRAQSFALVGISVSCSDRLESLAADIRAIRRHSRNRAVGIMVGGPPFVAHPQLAAMVGADATAVDGRQAVNEARCLVGLLAATR